MRPRRHGNRRSPFRARAKLGAVQDAEPADPVRCCTAFELRQARELALLDGDDQLAAALVREGALGDVLLERALAGRAELGLQRAWRVVDARMNHPRVVAGLMRRDLRFLLEQGQAKARTSVQESTRSREPEDACTDDDDVIRPRPLHGPSLYDRAA